MIPALLREVDKYFPSGIGALFVRRASNLAPNGLYSNDPNCFGAFRTYLQEFEGRTLETAVVRSVAEVTAELGMSYWHDNPVVDFCETYLKVDWSAWTRSAYYNEICKPLRWGRSTVVSIATHQHLLGRMALPRTVDDPSFTMRELRLLKAIAPFIAHALTEQQPGGPFVDGDDRGLVIVDATGAIQHAGREGRTLLMLARYATNTPLAATRLGDGLPEEVIRLCQRVAAFSDATPLPTPPVWRCKSGWGEFVFRVFRMEQVSALPSPRLLGVSIERREPLRLKLLRRIGELPLSTRETELCLALLDGGSRGAIAERLGIGETTAITHCRNLYSKLDVHNRIELVEKLHAM